MPLLGNTFTHVRHSTEFLSHLVDEGSLEGIESRREVKPLLADVLLECLELLSVLLSSQGIVLLKVTLFFVCLGLRSILAWVKLVGLVIHLIDTL